MGLLYLRKLSVQSWPKQEQKPSSLSASGYCFFLGTSRTEQVPASYHGAWISLGMSITWVTPARPLTGAPYFANKVLFLKCHDSKFSFVCNHDES